MDHHFYRANRPVRAPDALPGLFTLLLLLGGFLVWLIVELFV